MFILAKPCLFLSRFDCYSEGWDGSFSQSACFQGANNERPSIWRHEGRNGIASAHRKQSDTAARLHTLHLSLRYVAGRALAPASGGCISKTLAPAPFLQSSMWLLGKASVYKCQEMQVFHQPHAMPWMDACASIHAGEPSRA